MSPTFVEWMLGYPAGWTEGASRTQRLKMLGNSVQVQAGELVGLAVAQLLVKCEFLPGTFVSDTAQPSHSLAGVEKS